MIWTRPIYHWKASFRVDKLEQSLRQQGFAVGAIASMEPLAFSRGGRVAKLRILHSEGELILRGEDLRKAVGYSIVPEHTVHHRFHRTGDRAFRLWRRPCRRHVPMGREGIGRIGVSFLDHFVLLLPRDRITGYVPHQAAYPAEFVSRVLMAPRNRLASLNEMQLSEFDFPFDALAYRDGTGASAGAGELLVLNPRDQHPSPIAGLPMCQTY